MARGTGLEKVNTEFTVPCPRRKDPYGSRWLQRGVLIKHNEETEAFPRSLKATEASCDTQGCQGASNRDEL